MKYHSEIMMQEYWNNLSTPQNFFTECNYPLVIHSTGSWNHESGPDFKNASVKIGNRSFKGDIELHLRASDWFTHGHHRNTDYANVILHVVCENDLKQEQRELLPAMLVLKSSVDLNSAGKRGRCADIIRLMGKTEARELFIKAGAHRFKEKSKRFTRQILIEGTAQSFWRFLFEAAGYKKNSAAFNTLFKRFLAYPENIRESNYEDILWGESGLLPDLARDEISPGMEKFARSRWNNWWRVRHQAEDAIRWNPGGRPANSPERRLAVLVCWIRNFGDNPLKEISRKIVELTPEEFKNFLFAKMEVSDELWDNSVNFNTPKKSSAKICGRSFALEVIVNVVLPALYAMTAFDIFEDSELVAEMTEKVWRILPPTQENAITKRAGELWFETSGQKRKVLDSAAARQGAIHVYREYCEKCQSDCNACKWLRY